MQFVQICTVSIPPQKETEDDPRGNTTVLRRTPRAKPISAFGGRLGRYPPISNHFLQLHQHSISKHDEYSLLPVHHPARELCP